VRLQHPRVHKYLPPEWRDLGKVGKRVFVVYTEKNGFSDNIFILPNGSKGMFFNYKQDPKVLEGYEFDGVWADELIPPDFLMALRYRLITRRGKFVITFTPVEGYTPVVAEYLSAAAVEESLRSELLPGENVKGCPPGHMPYVLRCTHPKRKVIFFFTEFNRFNPYDELRTQLLTAPTRDKKIRAYGWPDRAKGNVFPKFGAHNIVAPEAIPAVGTNYHYIDFAWDRNWFCLWLRVTEMKGKKRIYVYREWPDYQTYGEWVIPSKRPDGDRGPAQTSLGFGIKDYKKLFWAVEKKGGRCQGEGERNEGEIGQIGRIGRMEGRQAEVIFARKCDPRSGRAMAVTEDGGTCLIDMLQQDHVDEAGNPLPGLDVQAASGDNITEGVNLINEWLEYDDGKPIGINNEPILYVSSDCRNLIDCLRMWTGQDGLKGASKDPIDTLRYAAQDKIEYMDLALVGSWGGGSY